MLRVYVSTAILCYLLQQQNANYLGPLWFLDRPRCCFPAMRIHELHPGTSFLPLSNVITSPDLTPLGRSWWHVSRSSWNPSFDLPEMVWISSWKKGIMAVVTSQSFKLVLESCPTRMGTLQCCKWSDPHGSEIYQCSAWPTAAIAPDNMLAIPKSQPFSMWSGMSVKKLWWKW